MKFLQTGDLHLGKLFYEFPLLEDQSHMLSALISELQTAQQSGSPYDALAICGDVYDRALPPAEAVQLFSTFLAQAKLVSPTLHILIIPGNHDSALRLSYASEILEYQNIHIRTNADAIEKPVIINGAAFYLLPFLTPGMIDLEGTTVSQSAMTAAAVSRITTAMRAQSAMPSVLCAHLFTAGSLTSESERTLWGTAEQVDASLFDAFTYTALGHLHKYQKTGRSVYYAGSPLVYSFDECGSEKCFLRVEIPTEAEAAPQADAQNAYTVTRIPVVPLRRAAQLQASFSDLYQTNTYNEYKDAFLEICSTDNAIVENPLMLLRTKFPYVLSFRQEKAVASISSADLAKRRTVISESNGNICEQFQLFLSEVSNTDDSRFDQKKTEQELFTELYAQLEEKRHETN